MTMLVLEDKEVGAPHYRAVRDGEVIKWNHQFLNLLTKQWMLTSFTGNKVHPIDSPPYREPVSLSAKLLISFLYASRWFRQNVLRKDL